MKRSYKIVFLTMLVISLVMTSFANAADPVVTLDPEEIEPGSTFTFMAELDDEDIVSVHLWTQECDDEQCYGSSDQNLTMTLQDGKYQTQITLKLSIATYFKYTIKVETSEGWIEYLPLTEVYLKETENGGGSSDDDDNGSPGFEIIVFLAAIAVSILLLKRKRS